MNLNTGQEGSDGDLKDINTSILKPGTLHHETVEAGFTKSDFQFNDR